MKDNHPPRRSLRTKLLAAVALLGLSGIVCSITPPIRFHRYPPNHENATSATGIATSSVPPDGFAIKFWDDKLIPATRNATDALVVWAAMRSDPSGTRTRYGRTPAIGGPSYYFIRGSGRVISRESGRIAINLDPTESVGASQAHEEPVVIIGFTTLFGNAVRDGTAMLNPADFPDSNDFNALSAELNKLVKTRVFPVLREKAQVGEQIRFAGISEDDNEAATPFPLTVVPVFVERP